ncbi:hypothetical protein [Parasitella parasitica]|uniref:Required for respiratory growth protein 9, mitochondrial n=1 Tax=Parasitella parasitica TaxID=35722 RepID=A0A0B7MX63_9FUNG|nr:hypothetical protein [Parasitella parasitica]
MHTTRLFAPAAGLFKGLARTHIQISTIGISGQRHFSNTFQTRNEEPTKTPDNVEAATEEEVIEAVEEAEPVKLSRRRRAFHEWVNGNGSKYSRPAKGTTNYLDASKPFPNNPLFQPRPPLSDARRQEIYDAFIADPEEWSVRKLATKFGVSLKRIEAILTLKASEKEMEKNGMALQKKFNKGMEQLMGVDQAIESLKEPLIDIFPAVGKPRFKTLKEDASFSPKDAADVLGRIPFKDLEKLVIASEQAEFTLPSSSATSVTSNDHRPTRHGKFVIVDTSS